MCASLKHRTIHKRRRQFIDHYLEVTAINSKVSGVPIPLSNPKSKMRNPKSKIGLFRLVFGDIFFERFFIRVVGNLFQKLFIFGGGPVFEISPVVKRGETQMQLGLFDRG
jgi:hypothetical protein